MENESLFSDVEKALLQTYTGTGSSSEKDLDSTNTIRRELGASLYALFNAMVLDTRTQVFQEHDTRVLRLNYADFVELAQAHNLKVTRATLAYFCRKLQDASYVLRLSAMTPEATALVCETTGSVPDTPGAPSQAASLSRSQEQIRQVYVREMRYLLRLHKEELLTRIHTHLSILECQALQTHIDYIINNLIIKWW